MKRTLLILAISAALAGCASFNQALVGYESAAVVSAKAANDNIIAIWSTAACATPISAAMRNPQIIPALKVLCMPGGDVAPVSLLDAAAAAPAKK